MIADFGACVICCWCKHGAIGAVGWSGAPHQRSARQRLTSKMKIGRQQSHAAHRRHSSTASMRYVEPMQIGLHCLYNAVVEIRNRSRSSSCTLEFASERV